MTRINKFLSGLGRTGRTVAVSAFALFAAAGIAQAATTISTNIVTAGTLSVTQLTALGQASTTMLSARTAYFGGTASTTINAAGAVSMPSTLSVTGLATLLGGATTTQLTLLSGDTLTNNTASSTVVSGTLTVGTASTTGAATVGGAFWVGGNATTTAAGAISTQSTLSVTSLATLLGGATTTQITLLSGDTIKNAAASSTAISGAVSTGGALTVGASGNAVNNIEAGYCMTAAKAIAATAGTATSTLTYLDCTPYTPAGVAITGLTAGTSRVFIQATSSLPYYVYVQSASSSATNLINVAVVNTSTSTPVASAVYAFNFWSFQ